MAESCRIHETDLLVIGGGPGGYTAAFKAAGYGIHTTIIDSDSVLGGVCLNRGCIPSKTLLAMAEMIEMSTHAKSMGIEFEKPTIHLDQVNGWKDKVITKLNRVLAAMAKRLKVDVICGKASFTDSQHVAVTGGEIEKIKFQRVIIAAGSRPVELKGIQIDSPRVVDSTGALKLERIPESVLVIGGGYIGLELGSVAAGLGSEVTVVEMLDSLIPGCDDDLAKPLTKRLGKLFSKICVATCVTGMKEVDGGVEVSFEGKKIPKRTVFDQVMVAVGRRPNSDQLNLEAIGVEVDDKGFIKVDSRMTTNVPNVYAIGDIVGNPMLAHKAMGEGKVVAQVLAEKKAEFKPACIPAVVFTDPEVAWAGLTETEAAAAGTPVNVQKMQWVASGRAAAVGRTDGLTKVICEPDTGRVLGVGIVGLHAGEMISEGCLAIEMGATAADIANTIHPHPTISELISEVADMMMPGGAPVH